MAKTSKKSLGEVLRTAPIMWLGETDIPNTRLLVFTNDGNFKWCLVKNQPTMLSLQGPEETILFSQDIFKMIYEVFPKLKEKGIGIDKPDLTELPKGMKITKDFNKEFLDRKIKPLPLEDPSHNFNLKDHLTSLGADVSEYEYISVKATNDFTIDYTPIVEGYDKYDPELLKYMEDVSKYKSWKMTKPVPYQLLFNGTFRGLIAAGKAGCGKSSDFRVACALHNYPGLHVQCTPNMEEDFLVGKWQPKEDGTGYEFKYGPLALAVKYDCGLLIDEFNLMPSGNMSCINSLLDDSGTLDLPNGEVLHRGPNFRLVLTCNPGYLGTFKPNSATLDRLITVRYPDLDKKTLIERLKQNTHYDNENVLEVFADKWDSLREIFESKNMDTEVTYRGAERFIEILKNKIKNGVDISVAEAFTMAFIDQTCLGDSLSDPEIADLLEVAKPYISDIEEAINNTSGDAMPIGTLHLDAPTPGLDDEDDIFNVIGDDGTPLEEE